MIITNFRIHRYLDISIQLKHLISLGYLDDILISNAFASKQELQDVARLYKAYVTFLKLKMYKNLVKMKKIILNNRHHNRADSKL